VIRLLLIALLLPLQAGTTIDVSPDGKGDHATLQAAIDAIPADRKTGYSIRLGPGTYREKIHIPADKPPIRLVGAGADKSIIVWNDAAKTPDSSGQELGTFRSATMTVGSSEFSAEGLTIENSYGTGSQALALRVTGDRCAFKNVSLLAWQDTLLVQTGRQYFEDCTISGHVDFIFGGSTAWFERCTIVCRGDGYITAASTPAESPYGLVFHACKIRAEKEATKVLLGRPWQNSPATIFIRCELPASIRPEGWDNWGDPAKEKTARYLEHRNSGPGAATAGRVSWAKQMDDLAAREITPRVVLKGWQPASR